MKARILLVEDDRDLSMVVSDLLRAEGAEVDTARDGHEGLHCAAAARYDLLILDVMLPGPGGFEICRIVRDRGFTGAILMLTARGQITDRVHGLRSGADDYVIKPFAPDELVARVDALLRRVRRQDADPPDVLTFGDITADFVRQQFTKAGRTLHLAGKEAELLRLLCRHPGETVTRDHILRTVWRDQPHITPRTVDVHMAWLRGKMETDPQAPVHLLTVRGEGYRFVG